LFELVEDRLAVSVRDPGVDRGGADGTVPQVILDEFERAAGVEEVGRDRMAKAVGREPREEPGAIAVFREQRLDLPLAEWAVSSREERIAIIRFPASEVWTSQTRDRREQRTFGPVAVLEPADDDARAIDIKVTALEQRDFPYSKTVQIDDQEEEAVAGILDYAEKPADFLLREVLRELLGERHEGGRGGGGLHLFAGRCGRPAWAPRPVGVRKYGFA
jgi:hypothetical protein